MVNKAYWNSQAVTAHANDVCKMLSYMAMGFFFYDLIISIPFDYKILTGKKKLRLVHLAYFSTKLSFLGFISILLTIFWAQNDMNCKVQFQVLEFFMGLTVFTSSSLLAFRTICVFPSKKENLIVKIVLIFLGLVLLAGWMQGVNDITGVWDSETILSPYTQGECIWFSVAPKYWVKYVLTIVFDATVLILTTVGITRMAGRSKLGLALIHQGLIYFLLTFLANLLIAIFTLLNLSPSMSVLIAVPQSAICVICSCRLHRELAEGQESRVQSYARPDAILSLNEKGLVESAERSNQKSNLGKRIFKVMRLSGSPSSFSENTPIHPQQLSYERGEIPSFISGTTAANTSFKSPPILFPNEEIVLEHNPQNEYFDTARGSSRVSEPILNEICISPPVKKTPLSKD